MKKKYEDPNILISKVYTKVGDKGKTDLIGGESVPKNDIRVVSYGVVDELNVLIGFCVFYLYKDKTIDKKEYLSSRLLSIQNELFNLGTMLASIGSKDTTNLPRIENENISLLEKDIDSMNKFLDPLQSFVLPGGNELILHLHLSRVVCRRAERNVVSLFNIYKDTDIKIIKYLNRLSDYLFVLGRLISKDIGEREQLWNPNNIFSNKI